MNVAASTPKAPRAAAAVRFALAAVAIAALLVAGRKAGGAIPEFAAWVEGLGALGPAAGAIFGLGAGVAYVFCAATLGSSLAFLVSRYIARGAIEQRLAGNASFAAIDQAVAAEGRRIVFLLRLSPAFPFTLLNYALGLTRVRYADFLVASVGMLPGTLLYVYYGKLAGDVAALAGGAAVQKDAGYYAVLALGLLATIAVTAVVTRTARRALADATSRKATGARTLLSARGAFERANSPASTLTARAPLDTGFATARMDTAALEHILGSRPASEALSLHRSEDTGPTDPAPGDGKSPHHSPVAPLDADNMRLLDNVRPTGWTNPEPASRYDLVVIGAGTGGLICAAVGAGLGARVALVERNLMGGDCLNYGCVPSKALIRHARRVAEARELLGDSAFDDAVLDREFAAAMQRMRKIRADISQDDSARRYSDELGVDVFQGNASFTGATTVEVDGRTLRFKKAVIASGARADVPSVPGLRETGFLTNETVFNLTERPHRLVVIGGGPIGCELAQAMRRLGCIVTIIDREERLLTREDADAAMIVQQRLEKEGVRLLLGAEVLSVSSRVGGKVIAYRGRRGENETVCDEILVAAGRRANLDGMGLDRGGVAFAAHGIRVDDNLRTSNPRVFAVGDCCMRWQFTHAADAAAKIVVQNALFFGRKKLSSLVMPWCTYTEPEIAHVGLYERDAKMTGIETETFTIPLEKVNRAVCDGETDGFVRVHTKKGSDRIVGATIVATHAGEMISEISLAITSGLGLGKIAAVIHPYPTQAEGIKAAANAFMRTKLTPTAKKFLGLLLKIQR
ncbi:MAG: FAD-containing oxidoreductase [Candidatus Binatia bacterium]